MKHRFKHTAEYLLLRGLLGIVNLLPLRAGLALGWLIGRFFFHVLRYRRDKAESRLKQVFGDRFSAKERKHIAWLSFRNICFNAIEAARFGKLTPEKLQKMPLYTGIVAMQEIYRKNGAFIFSTAHMGNWDLGGIACKLAGIPVFSIARRQKNPLTDDLLNKMRNATGMDVVLNDSKVLKNIIRRLKAGEVLAILPDVRSNTEALSIDFLGGKANLGAGAALFAQMVNCPIYPVALIRLGWMRHEYKVFDPIFPDPSLDKKEDWQRMMQQLVSIFDAEIHARPEQYFWFNKRWVLDPIKRAD
jgi:Kdo2-lipid IVA lauroyltransferase/acyltransferase